MAAAGRASERGASIEAASNRHAPALFLLRSAAAGTGAYLALQRHVPPDLVLVVDATCWLAVVSSISFTEAWVKFRAPLLDRHVAVDVGRRVFRAQYALEGALAGTAAALLWARAGGSAQGALAAAREGQGGALLAAAAAILLLELVWLFPALDLRGKHLIAASAAAQPEALSAQHLQYAAELRRQVAKWPLPPPQLHLLSVLLALAKAGLPAGFVWHQMLALV